MIHCYAYFSYHYYNRSQDCPMSMEHYQCLIDMCFRNSSYVSYKFADGTEEMAKSIESCRVFSSKVSLPDVYKKERRFIYKASGMVKKEMLSWTDDLFNLHSLGSFKLPEDPVFLRRDGSVFFDSTIHEGECFLYPQVGEDISEVLAFGNWMPLNKNYKPVVLAKDYQLPFPALDEIIKDELYCSLIRLKNESHMYPALPDIHTVTDLIKNYCPPFLRKHPRKIALPESIFCLPTWYFAFAHFLLGECGAFTETPIDEAIYNCGYKSIDSFNRFFDLLDQYLEQLKNQAN